MKQTLISIILLILGSLHASPLTPARQREVTDAINAAAAQISSINCNFVQTKELSLLNDRMVSRGTMSYSRPDRLRWAYTTPVSYTFEINGDKVTISSKGREDLIDTSSNKLFRQISRIMMSTVTGTALSARSDFSAEISEGRDGWLVTLTPRTKELRGLFSRIMLTFTKADLTISGIDIYEKNSDHTNIKLTGMSVSRTAR